MYLTVQTTPLEKDLLLRLENQKMISFSRTFGVGQCQVKIYVTLIIVWLADSCK
jgi:hypothetical protein